MIFCNDLYSPIQGRENGIINCILLYIQDIEIVTLFRKWYILSSCYSRDGRIDPASSCAVDANAYNNTGF